MRLPLLRRCSLLGALLATLAAGAARAEFVIGFYDHDAQHMCELARAGVTLLILYNRADRDPKPLLDQAQTCGLRVALQVETRMRKDSDDLGGVEALVRAVRGHPALAAWYAFDEPELHFPRDRVVRCLALLRRLDPAHPLLIVYSAGDQAHAFAGLADQLGLDYYPVTDQRPLSRSLEQVVPLTDRLLGWAKTPPRPTYFVVQSFSWSDFIKCPGCRFPTRDELRYLIYAPLVSGVDGVIFWTRYRTTDGDWKAVVEPLIRELASLRPSLARTRDGRLLRPPLVRARLLPDGLVIAVNDQPRAVATTRIQGPEGAHHADVIGEGRRLPTVRGIVVDTFGPYGVHLYRFRGAPAAR